MTTRITKKRKIIRSSKGGIRNLTRKKKSRNKMITIAFKRVQKGGFFWTTVIQVLWPFVKQAIIESDSIKLYAGYVTGYATQWITQITLTSNAMKGLVKTLKDNRLTYKDKGDGKYEILEPEGVDKEALITIYGEAVRSIELNQNLWLTNYDSWMSTLSYFVKNVNGIISSVAANIALNNDVLQQLRAARLIRGVPAVAGPPRGGGLNATRRQNKLRRISGGAGNAYTNPLPSYRNPPPSSASYPSSAAATAAENPIKVAQAAAAAAAAAAPNASRPPLLVKEVTGEYDAQPWNKAILGYSAAARGMMMADWDNYKAADTQYAKAIGQFKNIITNVKTELSSRANKLATTLSALKATALAKAAHEMRQIALGAMEKRRAARNEANNVAAKAALSEVETELQEMTADWGKKDDGTGKWETSDTQIIDILNMFKEDKATLSVLQDKLKSIQRNVNFKAGGALNNDRKYSEILDDLVEMMMIIWKNAPLKQIEKEIREMENDPNSDRLMLLAYRVSKAKMFNEPMPKIVGGAGKTTALNSNQSYLDAREKLKTIKMECTIAKTRDTVTYLRSITVDGLLNLVVWTKTYIEMEDPQKVIDSKVNRNIIAKKMFSALILFMSNMLRIQQTVCPIIQAVYPGVMPIETQIGNDFKHFMNTALSSNVFSKDYEPDVAVTSQNFSSWEESITDIRNILDCREEEFVEGAAPPIKKSDYFDYWKANIEPTYQNMKSGSLIIQTLLEQRTEYDKAAAKSPAEATKFLLELKAKSTNSSRTLKNAPTGIKPSVEASVKALNSNPFLKATPAAAAVAAPVSLMPAAPVPRIPESALAAVTTKEAAAAPKKSSSPARRPFDSSTLTPEQLAAQERKAAARAAAAAAKQKVAEAAKAALAERATAKQKVAEAAKTALPPRPSSPPPPAAAKEAEAARIAKAKEAEAAAWQAEIARRKALFSLSSWRGGSIDDETPHYWGSVEEAFARNSAYNRRRAAIESKNIKKMSGGAFTDTHFKDYFGKDMIKKYYGNVKSTEKIDSDIPLLIPLVDGHEAEELLNKVLLEPTEEDMKDFESTAAIIEEDLGENRLNNINNTLFQGGRYRF
jgi:hypothetical protein